MSEPAHCGECGRPLASQDFADWCRFHKTLLACTNADYAKMLEEQEFLFERMGATPRELDDASCWLADRREILARPWAEHMAAMRARIRSERAKTARLIEVEDKRKSASC